MRAFNCSSHVRMFRCTDGFSKCHERGDYYGSSLVMALLRHGVLMVRGRFPHGVNV